MRAFLLSVVLCISCMTCSMKNIDKQDTSMVLNLNINDFTVFWNDLGQALRVNDSIALDKYLDTLVYFYGREDEDPKFELKNRNRIIKVREIYLTSGFYDFQKDANISYVDFFLSRDEFKSDFVEGQDVQNIKDFVFNRNKRNVWKLTAVYSNTKKLKKP